MRASTKFREPLYDIAARLNTITFADPGNTVAANFHEQQVLGCIRHYLLSPSRYRKLWTVRLFIGGKIRTIGATERGADAARFADMAVRRFAKYRKRATGHNDNLNFTAEQAQIDEASEPEAVQLLDTIERYFLDCGVIVEPGPETAATAKPRGLKSDMLVLHAEIMNAIGALREEIKQLARSRILRSDAPVIGAAFKQVGPGYIAPSVGDPPPGLAPVVMCKNNVDAGSEPK